MKNFFTFIFITVILCTIPAYAEEIYEEMTVFLDADDSLPQTCVESEFALMSIDDTFETRILDAWNNRSTDVNTIGLGYRITSFDQILNKYLSILYENYPVHTAYVATGGSFGCIYDKDTGEILTFIIPEYANNVSPEDFEFIRSEISEETEKILLHIRHDMNDFEKVMTVHDYMVLNYQYDTTGIVNDITIMNGKKGMCMSYAFAFNHIMNQLGIESTYVSSEAMHHAWNLVKIDGNWYHIDVTWDDPEFDHYAHVHHNYALESSYKISYHPNPYHMHIDADNDGRVDCDCHYGYNLNGIRAGSTLYDNASWRSGTSAIVFANGKEYWISGDKLVCSDGKIIYPKLKTGNNWHINSKYVFSDPDAIFAGLAVYDNVLYFNTDKAIMSYDTESGITKTLKNEIGIHGLYIDNGVLKYSKYNMENGHFEYGGEIKLGEFDVRLEVDDKGNVTVDFYKEKSGNVKIIAVGEGNGNNCNIKNIKKNGHISESFKTNGKDITVFFWDENLRPLKPKQHIKF